MRGQSTCHREFSQVGREARGSLDCLNPIAMVTHINPVGDLSAVEMATDVKVTIKLLNVF